MTSQCIHGFPTQHCVSCRTCAHGQLTSSCTRCRTEAASRKPAQPAAAPAAEQHAGFEIFYEPAVSGWRYRGAEAAASEVSYRSAFLARKAVDGLASGEAAPSTNGKRSTKKSRR